MPQYKIADVIVDMEPRFEETSHWYTPYLYSGDRESDFSISASDEERKNLIEIGIDFTDGIAENAILCNQFNRRLLRFDGSFIHSSAMLFDGKVYLFSGHSGVGKSTLTTRWSKHYPDRTEIINDDKPSFRMIDGKCIVYGTPFAGGTDKQLNKSGELAAIVFLEQADHNTLRRLSSSEAITLLLQQTPGRLNHSIGDKLLSMYSEIISAYPIYCLSCTDSDDAVTVAFEITKQI